MKKRVIWISLAVVLALGVGLVGCGGGGDGGQHISLEFATFWGATHGIAEYGFTDWANTVKARVEAETEHTLDVHFTYSVKTDELLAAVNTGAYDIITTGPGYYAGVFPLWDGPQMPADLCRKNALTASMAVQKLYDEFEPLQNEVRAKGNIEVMLYWSTGPGWFFMTPGNNVTTLEDFPNLTHPIRAANPASVQCIEALNGTALQCAMNEALEKFEAGSIDGILCPSDTPKGFGLASYIQSGTFAPFSYQFVFFQVINRDTWNDLPDNVKTIINEVNDKYTEYYGKLFAWTEYDSLLYCRSEIEGWSEYNLPEQNPTEYQRWLDATAGIITNWVGSDTTRQQLWDKYQECDEYYCQTAPWSAWAPSETRPQPPTFP